MARRSTCHTFRSSCARTAAKRKTRVGKLPVLVELRDIRGGLHAHTTTSDGHDRLEAVVPMARALGHINLLRMNSAHTNPCRHRDQGHRGMVTRS